jgi:hypothetical protein
MDGELRLQVSEEGTDAELLAVLAGVSKHAMGDGEQ